MPEEKTILVIDKFRVTGVSSDGTLAYSIESHVEPPPAIKEMTWIGPSRSERTGGSSLMPR